MKLDELIQQKDSIMCHKRGRNDSGSSSNMKKLSTEISNIQVIIEELSERKAQLALRNYDYIDKHMRALDEQIRIVENAMKQNGCGELINKSSSNNNSTDGVTKRGRGRPVLNHKANKKSATDPLLSDIDHIDPNEPVYCICRQIAYGEMIACDNDECEIEWFHYSCVNLNKQPKNAWFCSTCKKI